jgi:ribosomal 30S subunit maturation factor RimM
MTVIDDESGETLGKVVDVIEAPAGEVFVLDLQGKEHLVTNAGEEVRRVDTKKKELRVKLLPEY